MRFGHFDDAAREYVIETPRTPYPWINYLGHRGVLRPRLAHRRRLLLLPRRAAAAPDALPLQQRPDRRRRPLLLHPRRRRLLDAGLGAGEAPSSTPTSAGYGLSYTKITGERNGIRAEVLYFVPLGTTAEVHRVTAEEHLEGAPKSVKLFSFVEFCLWNAADDQTNYQRNLSIGEVEVDGSTIYHKTEYRERRNHYAVHSVNAPVAGFDTDRESFLGLWNGFGEPQVVAEGRSPQLGRQRLVADRLAPARRRRSRRARRGASSSSSATSRTRRTRSGRSRASSTRRRRGELLARFQTHASRWTPPSPSCATTGTDCSRSTRCSSGDERARPDGQHLEPVPVHGDLQHVALRLVLRDRHRPRHGLPRLEPGPARLRAPGPGRGRASASSTSPPRSSPDGSAYHQYQPLTKRGNNDIGSGFNDDPLWLISGVAAYVKEIGRLRDPRRDRPLRQRPEGPGAAVRAPQAVLPPRAPEPRAPRPAADRPRRLERLPQPQLLLRDARRVVPDHRQPRRPHRRVRVHRRPVRARGPGLRRARRGRRAAGRGQRRPRARGARWSRRCSSTAGTASGSCAPTTSSARRSAPGSARTARSSSSRRATA